MELSKMSDCDYLLRMSVVHTTRGAGHAMRAVQ
jgi:hypothetical protein